MSTENLLKLLKNNYDAEFEKTVLEIFKSRTINFSDNELILYGIKIKYSSTRFWDFIIDNLRPRFEKLATTRLINIAKQHNHHRIWMLVGEICKIRFKKLEPVSIISIAKTAKNSEIWQAALRSKKLTIDDVLQNITYLADTQDVYEEILKLLKNYLKKNSVKKLILKTKKSRNERLKALIASTSMPKLRKYSAVKLIEIGDLSNSSEMWERIIKTKKLPYRKAEAITKEINTYCGWEFFTRAYKKNLKNRSAKKLMSLIKESDYDQALINVATQSKKLSLNQILFILKKSRQPLKIENFKDQVLKKLVKKTNKELIRLGGKYDSNYNNYTWSLIADAIEIKQN